MIKIKMIGIDKIIPYVRNAKEHPESQIKQIAGSIKEFGFNDPIAVDEDNVIIEGHGRLLAAQLLKLKEVPTIKLEHLNKNQKKAYIIAHNKLTMNTGFDMEILELEIESLEDFDFDIMGFDDEEIQDILGSDEFSGNTEEDAVPELDDEKEPIIKLGDLIELGEHRLLCGDSTNKEDVKKLMDDKKADMVFTDPPYDFENNGQYANIISDFSSNAHILIMHDDQGLVEYLRTSTLDFKRFFVADFTFSSPRGNDPYLRHILLLHETKGKAIVHQNLHDGFGSIVKMKYRGFLDDEKTDHKHQKSISFIEKFINHYSLDNMLIFDLFLGSGSTLIACEKTKRKCYGMELDEHYCDVIITRYCEYVGNDNVKINGEAIKWKIT